MRRLICLILPGVLVFGSPCAWPATPGLPFTEDFSATTLRDSARTTANWDTAAGELLAPLSKRLYGAFGSGTVGSDITSDAHDTRAVALGDVDGDGDLDLVVGNRNQTNRLYLNNGTSNPWNGVLGRDITSDIYTTVSVALGDVDRDGDLDLVTGNDSHVNRLYLNNGTSDPWDGVAGSNITGDSQNTQKVILADVDGDGDLDLVVGNSSQPHRLYLNNGTSDPWSGVSGSDISSDAQVGFSIALGDVDGDGDLDLITGYRSLNYPNRLYLNNGTSNPWGGVSGIDITGDAQNTGAIALGDVDADGDLDLVVVNETDQDDRLYLNNGTANPWNGVTGIVINSDLGAPTWALLEDVDSDGNLDLALGMETTPNRLYLNNGTSDPWNGVTGIDITSDDNATHSIAMGDVDNDGDLDLVAGNNGNGAGETNRLYLNNANENPWNGVTSSNVGSDTYSTVIIETADVNRDGHVDVIAGNDGQQNRLYLNNGTSAPFNGVAGTNIGSDAARVVGFGMADFNGDGRLDIAIANGASAPAVNRMFLNDGAGDPFDTIPGINITSDANNSHGIATGDIDNDGDVDIVVANYGMGGGEINRLYRNDGTGVGWTGTNITSDLDWTATIVLGDFNGDGWLDVAAGNWDGPERLYLSDKAGDPFDTLGGVDLAVPAGGGTHNHLVAGDVDQDGDLDLVAADPYSGGGGSILYLNNGTSAPFTGVTPIAIPDTSTGRPYVRLFDVDGDSDLDLVTYDRGEAIGVHLNNGTTDPWAGVSRLDIAGSNVSQGDDISLADVDNDGDLDLVQGVEAGTTKLYLSTAADNGGLHPWNENCVVGSDIALDSQHARASAVGDVDHDGDLDLVVGNDYGYPIRLYLNDGDINAWDMAPGIDIGSATDERRRAIALRDVDRDGDLDLIVAQFSGPSRLYLNNGTVAPWNGVSFVDITSDSYASTSLAVGDVDRDGDLDLIIGNEATQRNRLYLNNGTTSPWNGVVGRDITTDAENSFALALGDVDRDGDLDLAVGNHNTQYNRLYLSDGTADPWSGVTGETITSDQFATLAIALGDVDRDGDLDLVAGNGTVGGPALPNRLYLNNGTVDPWSGVAGKDITSDTDETRSVALWDIDSDGDLDLIAGNVGVNRLYLNNGTSDPWNGVTGTNITADSFYTRGVSVGDVDGDGTCDIITVNNNNRLYRCCPLYKSSDSTVTSLTLDTESGNIPDALLTVTDTTPDHTSIRYYLSNNGGAQWFLVKPGVSFNFPTTGSDLRWRAELSSLSPVVSASIQSVMITGSVVPTETPTATATQTDTATATATPTVTETSTSTATDTSTPSPSKTPVPPTATPTWTGTETSTPTNTDTPTATDTPTVTQTGTHTSTFTPTITQTPTSSGTHTPTATGTSTRTATPSHTSLPTSTGTATHTVTPTSTGTNTETPLPTETQTPQPTATATNTETSLPTHTSTPTASVTHTPQPSTATASATPTGTATVTGTNTVTRTATPTRTATGTHTPSASITQTPTNTQFGAPSSTPTQTPTVSGTATVTPTDTVTETPSPSASVTQSETASPTATGTPTPSRTVSATPTPSETLNGPTPTATASPTATEVPRLVDVIPDDTITLGPGLARFAFSFSVPMNQQESPTVTYGRVFPFALGTLFPDPGWTNDFTWVGVTELPDFLTDGLYTLRVRNAETQDGSTVPEDSTHQFRFLKQNPNELTEGRVTDEAVNALGMEWERSGNTDVSGHIIGSAPQVSGPYDVVAGVGSSEDAFIHLGLNSDTAYFYRIYEVSLNKGNGNSVRQLTNTFDGRTLVLLANGRAEGISYNKMKVSWDSNDDPSVLGFRVRRATRRDLLGDCGENPGSIITEASSEARAATDEGLHSNTIYFYDICLLDQQGNTSRLENPFVGRTLGMDPNGDGTVDAQDLLWFLDAATKGQETQDILIEFSLQWDTSVE